MARRDLGGGGCAPSPPSQTYDPGGCDPLFRNAGRHSLALQAPVAVAVGAASEDMGPTGTYNEKKPPAAGTLAPPQSAGRRVTAVGHRPTRLSANRRRLSVNRRPLTEWGSPPSPPSAILGAGPPTASGRSILPTPGAAAAEAAATPGAAAAEAVATPGAAAAEAAATPSAAAAEAAATPDAAAAGAGATPGAAAGAAAVSRTAAAEAARCSSAPARTAAGPAPTGPGFARGPPPSPASFPSGVLLDGDSREALDAHLPGGGGPHGRGAVEGEHPTHVLVDQRHEVAQRLREALGVALVEAQPGDVGLSARKGGRRARSAGVSYAPPLCESMTHVGLRTVGGLWLRVGSVSNFGGVRNRPFKRTLASGV